MDGEMAKEIERKFLVINDSWRDQATSATAMRQAYLSVNHDRSIRVRTSNDETAKLTVKFGNGTLSRDEFEYDIPHREAEEMLDCAIGIVLEKTRFIVPYQGYVWEVDVYEGAYRGLVIDYRVRAPSGLSLTARRPSPAVGGPAPLAVGRPVRVSFHPDAGTLVPV